MDSQCMEKFTCTKNNPKRRYKASDQDFVAPDGGWGWLIVVACGFSNLAIFPMIQQFGLVFLDNFETLQITNAQTTTIINVNSALTACVGLFNGPIYRKFTYRQVAIFGSCLVVASLIMTIFCRSFITYLFSFAILYGAAVGVTQAANAIALNTYFKKKRSIATGLSWGTTAFGPIIWPYVITYLLSSYGMKGTILIFSGFACHSIMLSLLLQPVHWHTKYRDEMETRERFISASAINEKLFLHSLDSEKRTIWKKISNAFDLDLLQDPIYLNIMIGMTLCNFCEINFSILTPFVLKEFKFDAFEIATFLSLLAATDIVIRFAIPFIGNKFGLNVRIYFVIGMIFIAFGRIVLIHTREFTASLAAAVMIGFGKGLSIVYLALLIPNHVPLQKLPAAAGLQLATVGSLFLLLGPVIGWIQDTVQNYVITLHLLNILSYIIVISWSIELFKTKHFFEKS